MVGHWKCNFLEALILNCFFLISTWRAPPTLLYFRVFLLQQLPKMFRARWSLKSLVRREKSQRTISLGDSLLGYSFRSQHVLALGRDRGCLQDGRGERPRFSGKPMEPCSCGKNKVTLQEPLLLTFHLYLHCPGVYGKLWFD